MVPALPVRNPAAWPLSVEKTFWVMEFPNLMGDPQGSECDCALWTEDRVFKIGEDLDNHDGSPVPYQWPFTIHLGSGSRNHRATGSQ